VVALIGLAVSAMGFLALWELRGRSDAVEFENYAQQIASSVDFKLFSATTTVDDVVALFHASREVRGEEFRAFAQVPLARSGSLRALAWVPADSDGAAQTIAFLASKSERDERVLFDGAAAIAIDKVMGPWPSYGYSTAVPLFGPQDERPDGVDFVILSPVRQRSEAGGKLAGYVLGFFSADSLVDWVRNSMPALGHDLYLFAPTRSGAMALLSFLPSRLAPDGVRPLTTRQIGQGLYKSYGMESVGGTWLLVVTPSPGSFDQAPGSDAYGVAAGGAAMTLLLVLYLLELQRSARLSRRRLDEQVANLTELRATQLELEQREEMLTRAADVASLAYWVYDIDNQKIVMWSDGFSNVLGYDDTGADPNDIDFRALIHPDDLATVVRARGILQDVSYPIEYRVLNPGTPVRYLREIGELVEGREDGKHILVGVTQDVTVSRKSLIELRSTSQLLTDVIETLPTLFWVTDAENRLIYMSHAWGAFRGEEGMDDVGQPGVTVFEKATHPDDWAAIDPVVKQGYFEHKDYEVTYRLRNAAGEYRWIEEQGYARFDGDGNFLGHLGACNDLTESRRLLDDARRSESRLRAVMENAAEGLLTIQPDGLIESCNRAGATIFGFVSSDMVARSIDALIPEFRGRNARRDMAAALAASMDTGAQEFDIVRRDGVAVTIELTLASFEAGETTNYIGVVRDVTERRAMEHKLRHAQKIEVLGNLTGGIAHDFNNILAVVIGNLEFVEADVADNDKLRDLVGSALEASRRGAVLTRQLLGFARRETLDPTVLDCNRLVGEFAGLIGRTLGAMIRFDLDLEEDLWPVMVDRPQLETALTNLAINARDSMDGRGRIVLVTRNVTLDETFAARHSEVAAGDYVSLSMCDDGSGMTPDVLDRILEPFFTTKPLGKGTGLGLPMVFGFVKQSGGHLSVYSEPGHGTSVQIYLPRVKSQESAAPVATGRAVPTALAGQPRVLLVDDDEGVRSVVAMKLTLMGCRIDQAANVDEARVYLERDASYALMVSDVIMPGEMNGAEFAAVVRERWPAIGVLLMSGFSDRAMENFVGRDAAVRFLRKPFGRGELDATIREMLG